MRTFRLQERSPGFILGFFQKPSVSHCPVHRRKSLKANLRFTVRDASLPPGSPVHSRIKVPPPQGAHLETCGAVRLEYHYVFYSDLPAPIAAVESQEGHLLGAGSPLPSRHGEKPSPRAEEHCRHTPCASGLQPYTLMPYACRFKQQVALARIIC